MLKSESRITISTYAVAKALALAAMEQAKPGSCSRIDDQVTFRQDVTFNLEGECAGSCRTTVHAGTTISLKPSEAGVHERLVLDHSRVAGRRALVPEGRLEITRDGCRHGLIPTHEFNFRTDRATYQERTMASARAADVPGRLADNSATDWLKTRL